MQIHLGRSLRSLLIPLLALCATGTNALTPQDNEAALAATTAIPRYDHVVVVMEENTSETSIYGNASAPHINSLKTAGVYFPTSFAVTHPSQPNYLALFSGT